MVAKSRILVTGGAGMIGSNLVRRLLSAGHDVHIADNLWRGKKEYLLDDSGRHVVDMNKNFHQIDLSIADSATALMKTMDYVIHLADIVAGIGYVFNNQGSLFRQNILINSNVVASARVASLKGFIYVGTACSFPAHMQSGIDARPLREEDQYPASPESAYGWSKLMGEYEALLMEQETKIPVSIPVLHNVYGSPCDYEDGRGQVIPSLIRKAIRFPNEPFIVWGSGSQGRAFIHVIDAVDGIVACLDKGLGKGIIQLGPDVCTSIREIAETVVGISGKNIEIHYDRTKPEGDRGRRADYSKARQVLGWEPRVKLEDGLAELYRWVEKQIRNQPAAPARARAQ
jgi:GDP-D-mannose 3',5'-epimerase